MMGDGAGVFRMHMRSLGAAALALGLTGCMSGAMYAERAVEHNRAIAQAGDQILLLNIVRSKLDRPVVYTQFDGVNESFENNPGVSVNVPFGADAGSFYSGNISFGPSQVASLSTSPLGNQDFYQGVMHPIKVGLLRYYLDNGWPRDLLIALTVEKLSIGAAFYDRVVRDSDALCAGSSNAACERISDPARVHVQPPVGSGRMIFYNDPRSPELFDPFHELVLRLIVLGLTVDGSYVEQELRIPATAEIAATSAEIQNLIDMGASVEKHGSEYVITTYAWLPALRLPGLRGSNVRVAGEVPGPDNIDMLASLRSPDSMLFYVGAYTRGGADAGVMVGGAGHERFVPVFTLEDCSNAVVQVEFDGGCYGIPRDDAGVSMKVMAFLHQVIGLNQRAADAPAPGIIRTTN